MPDEPKIDILNKTLGELLRGNDQARNLIMKSMNISLDDLNDMVNRAGDNQLMNMTIGELFKNGMFQKAQNLTQLTESGQILQTDPAMQPAQGPSSLTGTIDAPRISTPDHNARSESIFQKIKKFIR